jgi:3-oxoacyl-[acyl-carrier protein] reductase
MEMKGKVCLVTGASGGIGRAICLELAKKGCKILANYFHSEEDAKSLMVKITSSYDVECLIYKADVSDLSQVKRMVEFCLEKLGPIKILINNAGIKGTHKEIASIDEKEWEEVINTNLKGVFNTCKAVVPIMQNQGGKGTIVNISSIGGIMGGNLNPVYAASKAGIIGFSLALAAQVSKDNIRVNVITPGAIATKWWEDETQKENVKRANPLKRFGTPKEVAKAVIFLIENDYVNGVTLPIDGGRYAFKNFYQE